MDSSAFREWSVVSIPLALYIPFLSRKISLKTKANEKGDNTLRCKHCDQPSEGSLFSDIALQCCDFMLDQSNKPEIRFSKIFLPVWFNVGVDCKRNSLDIWMTEVKQHPLSCCKGWSKARHGCSLRVLSPIQKPTLLAWARISDCSSFSIQQMFSFNS